jgi:hypothetical protein
VTSSNHSYRCIRFRRKIPEFTAVDLEVYGPFEGGDEVELPEDNTEILVNRGQAVYIDEGDDG